MDRKRISTRSKHSSGDSIGKAEASSHSPAAAEAPDATPSNAGCTTRASREDDESEVDPATEETTSQSSAPEKLKSGLQMDRIESTCP